MLNLLLMLWILRIDAMQVYLDFNWIRSHMQYVEDQRREVEHLLKWAEQMEKVTLVPENVALYDRIRKELDKIRRSMCQRIEILGEMIVEFSDVSKKTDADIDKIRQAFRSIEDF